MKLHLLVLLIFGSAIMSLNGQIEGTWKIAPEAGSLAVGPAMGDFSWWSISAGDVVARDCFYDDEFVFNADGSFQNVQGDETWNEPWQGMDPEGCAAPIAPHDGSSAATWSFDEGAGTITLTGVGAYLGLAKVNNGGELAAPGDAPESITYPVVIDGNTMTIDIDFGGTGFWHFVMEKSVAEEPELAGSWKIAPEAGSLAVGPTFGDFSWWSISDGDVTARSCFYDDEYVFNADGSFQNVQGDETWNEPWQGMDPEGCAAPIAPHDGSNAATWSYDEGAGTITLTGVGAYLGLAKVNNGGELASPGDAPESITYPVVMEGNRMTIDIDFGGTGFWHFVLEKGEESDPNLIFDFETEATSANFQYFGSTLGDSLNEIIANPNPTGVNTSDFVASYIKPADSETWAGAFASSPITIVAASGGQICADVHMDHIGNLAMKLENGNGDQNWTTIVENTVMNEWETLCFDFDNPSVDQTTIPASGNEYSTVVVFFDFGSNDVMDVTSYFDNIVLKPAVTSGVTENAIPLIDFQVTPNFTKDFTMVRWSELGAKRISVYNVSGNLMQSIRVNPFATEQRINVEGYTQGTYFIRLESENKVGTQKLVIGN